VSLSNDGNTLAIGAPRANSAGGRARVYRYGGVDWAQLGGDIQLLESDITVDVT
jgi:hypothetical protein